MIAAVGRLASPDCDERIAVHARQALDAFKRCFVLGQKRAAINGEFIEIRLRQIVCGGLREFRLPVVVDLRATGKIEIGYRIVGLDAGERRVECLTRDPLGLCVGPKTFDEGMEIPRPRSFRNGAAAGQYRECEAGSRDKIEVSSRRRRCAVLHWTTPRARVRANSHPTPHARISGHFCGLRPLHPRL